MKYEPKTRYQRQLAESEKRWCGGGCGNVLALYLHERGICDTCQEKNELALDMAWLRAARLKDQESGE